MHDGIEDTPETATGARRGDHTYGGHRKGSFFPEDVNEIIELRARQRTYEGAYLRSGLTNLGYALTILRLFDKRFARIGIVYCVLAVLLFVISYFRRRHSDHDFADLHKGKTCEKAIPTVGQTGKRSYGRPFTTAGQIVVAVAVIVATVEIGLLVLILTVDLSNS
ncbi:uncharacterized protein LAESUDRAFT_762046 [Laetiporus sulphureus 93-53]|uniref:DUF202 domain-containing protein n=1 Tax=Laetiporus sulphureus 93-53 TaxID=1314785 RepID=A0A165CQW8_9APHY|nr:uncharacterized protein LAESUDRAFT_762046 [Laetiporus sulphureus 93-53]KZT03260.1 hypothetical protein LAESUDRAFT_762046 [Laetiporus sulphureus 93-53]